MAQGNVGDHPGPADNEEPQPASACIRLQSLPNVVPTWDLDIITFEHVCDLTGSGRWRIFGLILGALRPALGPGLGPWGTRPCSALFRAFLVSLGDNIVPLLLLGCTGNIQVFGLKSMARNGT